MGFIHVDVQNKRPLASFRLLLLSLFLLTELSHQSLLHGLFNEGLQPLSQASQCA